jgi:hypothetical protein
MKKRLNSDARRIFRPKGYRSLAKHANTTAIPTNIPVASKLDCPVPIPPVNCDPPLVGCTGPVVGSMCGPSFCGPAMPITVCAQDPSYDRGWPAVVPNFVPYGNWGGGTANCNGANNYINNGPPAPVGFPQAPYWPPLLPCNTPYPIPAWTMN